MNSQEIWQVEVKGQIYETNLTEIVEWIGDGAVLPDDRARKGNLRWLKADKIPELSGYFNGKSIETKSPVATTVTKVDLPPKISAHSTESVLPLEGVAPETIREQTLESESLKKERVLPNAERKNDGLKLISADACSRHTDVSAQFICQGCDSLFCKTCPDSYGGVKICPECGEMCRIFSGEINSKSGGINKKTFAKNSKRSFEQNYASVQSNGKFGFADFGRALIYPFNFKTSLIVGAVMFTVLMLGQSVSSFGLSMYFPAVVCLMLANALVFGSLANTLDNFSGGKTDADFMPGFDDFNSWDDVIHPFLLSLGVYLISFGMLFALIFAAIWYASGTETKIEADKQKILSTVFPAAQNALNSDGQIFRENQLSKELNPTNERQIADVSTEGDMARLQQNSLKQTADLRQLQNEINQSLQAQKQAETEENVVAEKGIFNQTVGTVLRLSLVFSVPIFLALLWGVFYFPAACAIAGYTRSFGAILDPTIGFDTIKRLGTDYYKIVGVFIILAGSAFGLNAILQSAFSSLSLPMLGNLPVRIFSSLLAFYLSIVFSVALGTMLFKNSEKLDFRRG